MKAARILEYKKPLVLEDISMPDIQPDEVLVKVAACGMCRSDVLLIDGFFQGYGDIPPPVTPGHEITGTIESIGSVVPKAAGIAEGDHVVVAPGWGDGVCRHCMVGDTHICPNVRWPGFGPHGGFAEYIPVPARYVIKVPKHLKFEQLAPLTDAGLTPYPDVGFVGDPIDIPLFPRVSGEQTFHGSFWGNNADLTEVMALAAEGKIQHTIKTISFDDINEHIDLMRDNRIVGRAVVTF